MPSGEDVTGLHAFDDLDQVSTVSALSAMPEMVLPQQVPQRAQMQSTMPPPPVRGAAPLPPPPRGGSAMRSVPPPPPGRREEQENDDAADAAEDEDSFEDTRLMSQDALDYGAEFDASEAEDDDGEEPQVESASTGRTTGIDDTELLELSATTVATKIEMDWDEDEAETKLRDEGEGGMSSSAPVGGRPSPFPPPMTSSAPFPGNPSPFGPLHSSFPPPAIVAPEHDEWEDDEDARTRVMLAPSFPPPPTLPRISAQPSAVAYTPEPPHAAPTLVGAESFVASLKNNRLTWIGFGAVGLIAAAIVTRALTAGADPATVTLVINPTDSQVIVDGRLLSDQTSPFTLQGLEPGVPHTLEVHKDGYATQKQQFSVNEGEVKPLPGIELVPLRVDTGFAIASTPAGAAVYVDGHKLDQVTPARVADLSPGLHVVRLEYAGGYQPWETQVALAKGQVIELPNARLVASGPSAQRSQPSQVAEARPVAERSSSSSSSSSSGGSSHHHHDSAVHTSAPVAMAPTFGAQPAPMRSAAPAPAASGSQGILRVNSRPWSQVFVDGRMIGNTPQLNVPLTAGKHKVKLVNPQLGMNKSFDVAIAAGKPTTKVVDLE